LTNNSDNIEEIGYRERREAMSSIIFFLLIAAIGWIAKKISEKAGNTAPTAKPPFKKSLIEQRTMQHSQGSKRTSGERYAKKREEGQSRQDVRRILSAVEPPAKEEEYYKKKAEAVMRLENPEFQGLSPSVDYFEEEDILKGVILSEVLGPPRSKRPYRK
jgi:hypothetical protein